ncbi:hypothetical protein BN988_01082 [Oceanobacillus picturae]|uniref:Uncharacterized protein n=1 Tax=Oceanobacillus picturae TaxID=171693 RepID=W9AA64_9BACI|nr:hypothetical protein [Oceanobacillus picturae]CDO02609.1 hypothetical protein BN988_01082 [Oceanobacillus picturae]
MVLREKDLRLRNIKLPEDLQIALPWYQDKEILFYSEGEGTEPYNRITIERMYTYLLKIGEVYIIEIQQNNKWVSIGDVTLLER